MASFKRNKWEGGCLCPVLLEASRLNSILFRKLSEPC